jgi:20S proteasome alpha/beta subunit
MTPYWEDSERMTLQIGLVGSDGIVLASDRLVNVVEAGDFTLSRRSKFFFTDTVICCWSGDNAARQAANYVRDVDWPSVQDRASELRNCGNRAWKAVFGGVPVPKIQIPSRKVLAAFPDDCSLWEIDICDYSIAERVEDKTVAGDARTTVRHIVNNYVPSDRLPTSELVVVASHSILMAHRENNAGVDGLEVAIIRKGEKPQFLTNDQEKRLERISIEIHASLSKQLLQEFDLQPRRAD